jgi:hypothetical protein
MDKYYISPHLEKEEFGGYLNDGWFDCISLNPNIDRINHPSRKVGCSMSSNIKVTNGITYMYIPITSLFDDNKPGYTEENILEIENSLKDWVRFGRQCGIPAEYLGFTDPGMENFDNVLVENLNFNTDEERSPIIYSSHIIYSHDVEEDHKANDKYDQNSFIIKWEHNNLVNSKHGLACLSFFRYFYSNLSNQIYINSIFLKNNTNWNELKCLTFAHYCCKQCYTGYYGLIRKEKLFFPINSCVELYDRITNNSSVNSQWSKEIIYSDFIPEYDSLSVYTRKSELLKIFNFLDFKPKVSMGYSQFLSLLYEGVRRYISFENGNYKKLSLQKNPMQKIMKIENLLNSIT